MARTSAPERYSFGNLEEVLELPDLIAIQRDSFQWFLDEGLAQIFRDISPITDFSENLQLELEFDPNDEDLRPPPKFSVAECKRQDMTYSAPVFVRARFMNAETGEMEWHAADGTVISQSEWAKSTGAEVEESSQVDAEASEDAAGDESTESTEAAETTGSGDED